MDCFYDPENQAYKELKEAINKTLNDKDYKQFEFSDEQWMKNEPYFYIDFGNKIAYIDGTLVWNSIIYQSHKSYHMKFMYKDKQWRLVR